jgi:protein SCO1/2
MVARQISVSAQPPVGGSFQLVDHHGVRVTEETYRGRFVLIFFGFTHCRVVCPRALSKLSAVLERLGPLADQLQALYITIDPERDTPEVMRAFLEKSYPRFTGLTGTRAEIDAAKRAFRVFAERRPDPQEPDGYVVPHTAISYLLDPTGQYAAHFIDALDETEVTDRLRTLLMAHAASE